MQHKRSSIFCLFKARLSRKIVFWIFLTLVVIEWIILIPSVKRREKELLEQLTNFSAAKVSWIIETYPNASSQTFLQEIKRIHLNQTSELMKENSGRIAGGVLYQLDGNIIGEFGELPELSFKQVMENDRLILQRYNPDRYDIAWESDKLPGNYLLILRHDSSSIAPELWAYKARIFGLVLLISLVLTST